MKLAAPSETCATPAATSVNFTDSEGRHHRHHGDEHAQVAHAVHDERFLPAVACGDVVPERDEEVGGEAHAFQPKNNTR